MSLEKELETYNNELQNLLSEEGKFVLIQGDKVIGTYTSYEDAIREGYRQFGLQPFLVKQIRAIEEAQLITRLLNIPCHT
jgi:hypothetical protein